MTDHIWQGVLVISTCWDGATSVEACNIYAERFHDLIPFTHHIEPTIYGNDVMDLTIFGLRSI